MPATGRNRLSVVFALRPGGPNVSFLALSTEVTLIRVPRLNEVDSRRIVTHNLSQTISDQRARLINWAVDLADGNPFFLVELSTHCRGDNPRESLPDSLQIALDRKFESLSPDSQLVLQASALLAGNASLGRLDLMLGLAPYALANALSQLEATGLIASRDGWVGCRHDLIAEAVVRKLSVPLGSYSHCRCAMVLDRELQLTLVVSLAWGLRSSLGRRGRANARTGADRPHRRPIAIAWAPKSSS